MPIAVSAIIKPSRLLRAVQCLCAAVHLGAGAALACAPPASFACPFTIVACCLLTAAAAVRACARSKNARRLDISGLGELRLTVQQEGAPCVARGGALRLAPGSTLWPGGMLLQLRHEQGGPAGLVILPDCVAGGQFRMLAVAFRSIAGRHNKFFRNNKII